MKSGKRKPINKTLKGTASICGRRLQAGGGP
jgi:hypothetical protein